MKAQSQQPLISCIMPTAGRRRFVPQAIGYFLRQDYPNKELVIVDDGADNLADLLPDDPRVRYVRLDRALPLGAKRNEAVRLSRGDLIAHWDDDDWIAPWRLSYQVEHLLRSGADICGLDRLLFYDPAAQRAWQYTYPRDGRAWVAGGTLCYTRACWQASPFPAITKGEDTRFVWSGRAKKILALDDHTFYVALIHPGNTSPKRTGEPRWHAESVERIRTVVGDGWDTLAGGAPPPAPLRPAAPPIPPPAAPAEPPHRVAPQPSQPVLPEPPANQATELPLVSCIMPTYNRRRFVPQAIKYFLRQDYPNKELIIVDDGSEPADDLVPADPRIRYIRLCERRSIGAKRNLACDAAMGEIVVCWDDDDWYGAQRIAYQVAPMLAGHAEVTGLDQGLLLYLPSGQFWACTPRLHSRMFAQGVVSGTLAFPKTLWGRQVRFPNASLAEDAALQRDLVHHGARLRKLPNEGAFIYIRHDANSWRFVPGEFIERNDWLPIAPPTYLEAEDRAFYDLFADVGELRC